MKIAILAFLIDAIIGDPQSRFHPVVLIGKLISGFERLLYRKEDSDARKFACGALLVLLVLAALAGIAVLRALFAALAMAIMLAVC